MWRKIFVLLLTAGAARSLCAQDSVMNDHMFPAAAVARPFIDYDAKGFLVKGKPVFIVSAGIEYARVPRALWRDRLLRLKRAGFNTVEIYTFWNFHEPQQGKFDFSGDHDLDHFLKLVRELGLYCIARVGPYYCAEWDQGGYPLWLRFKPGLRVREPNDTFQKYVGLFFDRLLPVIRDNQIHRGGSVIMVQLENEHTRGWGTVMPDRYFTFLRDKAIQSGIEVPYFFSGLHHDTDPVGDKASLDDPGRPNPWMTTEFWSVWFNQYGAAPGDADKYERFTRKIIARGGGGYNYYMAHGGSNFGYSNNDEDAASYDYGAAIGQAGDLRPLYYRMKRCAYFATSFADVLATSQAGDPGHFNADTGIAVTHRVGKNGGIYFLDNHTEHSIRFTTTAVSPSLPKTELTIAPGEIVPLVHDYHLNADVTLTWSSARILGWLKQAGTSTLVCYGEPGSQSAVFFQSNSPFRILRKGSGLTLSGTNGQQQQLGIQQTIGRSRPDEYLFQVQGETVRVLFLSEALADRTWFVASGGQNYLLCGPRYISEFSANGGRYQLQAEYPMTDTADVAAEPGVLVYSATGVETLSPEQATSPAKKDTLLSPVGWKLRTATGPAAPGFDDSRWPVSANPAQMGIDGHAEPEAWYRTVVDVKKTGIYKLEASGGDRAIVYIDGKPVIKDSLYKGAFLLPVSAGRHSMAVYTAEDGRDKLPGYTGPLDSVNIKGLTGEIWLKQDTAASPLITAWRFIRAGGPGSVDEVLPDSGSGWKSYQTGDDAFEHKTGYGWFETRIDKPAQNPERMELLFKSVDEDATVFVNGKKLKSHKGWNQPFRVPITVSNETKWPLVLDVFIENHSNEGGIDQPVTVNSYGSGDERISDWRLLGGTPADPGPGKPVSGNDTTAQTIGPAYYTAHFQLTDTSAGNSWRVDPAGLDHGYVWVNGRNLGHYPEKIGAPGLYIPNGWLKRGDNEIRILDETGASPGKVVVRLEKTASRRSLNYHSMQMKRSSLKKDRAK